MPIYTLTRYEVPADSRADVERAMHELASRVRRDLPDTMWTVYRDSATPTRYIALARSDTPAADARCRAMCAPLAATVIDSAAYELVTSSDLARRRR